MTLRVLATFGWVLLGAVLALLAGAAGFAFVMKYAG